MLSKSLSFSVFFLKHPHTHLFLQSWPGVSRVCSKLSAQDYWRKSGRPSNMSKCFQHDANKTVSLPLYKHVNVLEHLRRNPFADTQSEQGLWDWWLITLVNWMAIHDSERLGDTSVFALVICLSGRLCDWRIPAMTVPINHSGHLSAEFKSCFGSGLHWGPAKAKRLSWSNDCH